MIRKIINKVARNENGLRVESSINSSGVIYKEYKIPLLKESDYIVKPYPLDGDAPKQFIKAYFPSDSDCVRKGASSSWCSYIAKTAEKWYPVESIIEYMINRIGHTLGLKMNEVRLVKANGQIRFLSKYFKGKDERLNHGAEICGAYLEDMEMAAEIAKHKPTARQLFTFEFIRDAIEFVYPKYHDMLLLELVKMIVFDAIVGNNDRHFYNWGILDNSRRVKNLPKFAPLYDSARGLFWNYSDNNIVNVYNAYKQGGKKIVTYIESAAPRISIEGDSDINHFELLNFLKNRKSEYADVFSKFTTEEKENDVFKMLRREFYEMFIPQRRELIGVVLNYRFNKIRRL